MDILLDTCMCAYRDGELYNLDVSNTSLTSKKNSKICTKKVLDLQKYNER